MLFPYHIFMIYNSWGENFYIKGKDIKITSAFNVAVWPWFMPLLFVVAGISAAYALQKRSLRAYVRERVTKLLIPLIAGILLLIPAQTYFAERFHNGYTGGYFAQYILFFTKRTDLTGYAGGFTPGQLWFVLYLFIISLAVIPLIVLSRKTKYRPDIGKLPVPAMLGLFIFPVLGALIFDIGGKSLGEYFAYFALGYFLLSSESIQGKLEKWRFVLLGIGLFCMAVIVLRWYDILDAPYPVFDIFSRFYAWSTVLALIGLGRKSLNMKNKFTSYMSGSSFSVYMFHQTWIVASAYYVFMHTSNILFQMALILLFSVSATFASYEICRRFKVTRFMFAIKKGTK